MWSSQRRSPRYPSNDERRRSKGWGSLSQQQSLKNILGAGIFRFSETICTFFVWQLAKRTSQTWSSINSATGPEIAARLLRVAHRRAVLRIVLQLAQCRPGMRLISPLHNRMAPDTTENLPPGRGEAMKMEYSFAKPTLGRSITTMSALRRSCYNNGSAAPQSMRASCSLNSRDRCPRGTYMPFDANLAWETSKKVSTR